MHYGSEQKGHLDHVAFRTADLDVLVARLESRGVSYSKVHVLERGMTQVFFSDPAGTGLEVNSVKQP